jgi:hypothetical protein
MAISHSFSRTIESIDVYAELGFLEVKVPFTCLGMEGVLVYREGHCIVIQHGGVRHPIETRHSQNVMIVGTAKCNPSRVVEMKPSNVT